MNPAIFEPSTREIERPRAQVLGSVASGISGNYDHGNLQRGYTDRDVEDDDNAYKEDDSGDCNNAKNQIRYVAVIISAQYLRCLRLEHRPGDDGPCWLTDFAIAMNLHNKLWIILQNTRKWLHPTSFPIHPSVLSFNPTLQAALLVKFDVHMVLRPNIIYILKPTSCTNVSNLFYYGMTLYMFRSFLPSSGVQDCTYSNRRMSNKYCCLLANKCLLLYVQS